VTGVEQPLVVIPTYNEADNLQTVVAGALAAEPRLQVLVVDDSSPDGTGAIADRLAAADDRVSVLHRTAKSGLGSAYRAGFRWALGRGCDVLCEMDADLSHDPADLARLLAALEGADLVIGSRYVPGGRLTDWSAGRRALSRWGNRYVALCTGMAVADATSGFRAYRASLLRELDVGTVRSEGYSFQIEMALRAWRAGFRIVEVPITFSERTAGSSKISRAIVAEALWRVPLWGVTGRRHPLGAHRRSIARAAG
jgi:dolichol-phosphate mannosyltransferase